MTAGVGAAADGPAEFDVRGEGFEARSQANASIPAHRSAVAYSPLRERACGIAGHACKAGT